jgi:stage III sporulation protein SpoIIIAA
MKGTEIPGVQWVQNLDDLSKVRFYNDMAEIEVPVSALESLPFKNEDRGESGRLEKVMQSIRRHGYNNFDPVIVRLGRRGRWVIVNGGHRVTAARKVAKEFWANLFGQKVKTVHFLLFKTPLTNSRLNEPEESQSPGAHGGHAGSTS